LSRLQESQAKATREQFGALCSSERKAFLDTANRRPGEVRTFCRLLAISGMRISEALALTPRHFDFSAGGVIVESLKKRRRGVFRAIPIPQELLLELDHVHAISECRRDPGRSIWTWCRTTAWNHVKVCMEDAGISGRQAMPKGLRHGFAVGVLQSGVPIILLKEVAWSLATKHYRDLCRSGRCRGTGNC
jgi:integrase